MLVAYLDGAHTDGTPKYSIGFGSQTGNPQLGDTITIADAFTRIKADIAARDQTIGNLLKVPVSQCTWDALASLNYQAGSSALKDLAAAFNTEPSTALAAVRFIKWNFGGTGIPTDGHTRRRIREMMIVIDHDYGDISQYKLYDGNPRKVTPQMTAFPPE